MDNNTGFNSELEKTNLEMHVEMARQRYIVLNEKVEKIDDHFDNLNEELADFRTEHAQNISDLKHAQLTAISALREEYAENRNSTTKIVVGSAATIIAGLLSVVVVLLVAFI